MNLRLVALMAASIALTGCAYNASPYGASVQNVEAVKTYNLKPVSVGKFQAKTPGQSSITCRAAGSVKIEPSFEAYIEKAFIDELKLAGAYDPAAGLVITGKLEQVDFSSGMTDGNWSFTLTLTNSRKESYTTSSKFPFSGSFVAEKACQEVAQAFSPAVQKLLNDIVRDPNFRKIAS
ncbi:hypothetical protein [Roseateles amylovorans]|uniref:Lipoprotein n=1 Tax=Roseateles amylovorans TaxID=2978473 RepID=A0ABY6B7R3_9BURK|nr:hypothetical protein [Roseateles amylovorans]UXH79251.1 hypothetical protein N4261_04770 [Roseateles amylovorans]